MRVIAATLAPFGLAAILYLSLIFSRLSERLNSVAKKKNYQPWFRVANGLIGLAALSQALRNAAVLAPGSALPLLLTPGCALLTFHVPLALGVTIELALVSFYWGWILREGRRRA